MNLANYNERTKEIVAAVGMVNKTTGESYNRDLRESEVKKYGSGL